MADAEWREWRSPLSVIHPTETLNVHIDKLPIPLSPDGWAVHIEAEAKDKAGQPLTYTIDGKIENLPVANRVVTGTWKDSRGNTGPFKIGRQ